MVLTVRVSNYQNIKIYISIVIVVVKQITVMVTEHFKVIPDLSSNFSTQIEIVSFTLNFFYLKKQVKTARATRFISKTIYHFGTPMCRMPTLCVLSQFATRISQVSFPFHNHKETQLTTYD